MKKGDKYIIEVSEVHTHYDDNGNKYPLARIKGFNSLVFDEFGLGKLEKVEDKELVEEKPQYLNCRFVVLKNDDKDQESIRVGGIYNVVDGKIALPYGLYPLFDHFKNFDEVVAYFSGLHAKDRIESKMGYFSNNTIKIARIEEDEE